MHESSDTHRPGFAPEPSLHHDSLTRHEWEAVPSDGNLADGHAHQTETLQQAEVLRRLPDIYQSAVLTKQQELQTRFATHFFSLAGQHSWHRQPQPLFHYSSSVCIEVVANLLRRSSASVALITPTFDNIPAILRRHNIPLIPLNEPELSGNPNLVADLSCSAVFLVCPNNPTGWELSRESFVTIAEACAKSGKLLIVDFSFRFFSEFTSWDQYETLRHLHDKYGAQYICIEDTGKTWPTRDLKIGTLLADPVTHPLLESISDEILLNVSPFVFALLAEYLSIEGGPSDPQSPQQVVRRNRETLRSTLFGSPVTSASPDSAISVEWLRLPRSWESEHFCDWLRMHGVHLLPGTHFCWDDSSAGNQFVRASLMRAEDRLGRAASALKDLTLRYVPLTSPNPISQV